MVRRLQKDVLKSLPPKKRLLRICSIENEKIKERKFDIWLNIENLDTAWGCWLLAMYNIGNMLDYHYYQTTELDDAQSNSAAIYFSVIMGYNQQ